MYSNVVAALVLHLAIQFFHINFLFFSKSYFSLSTSFELATFLAFFVDTFFTLPVKIEKTQPNLITQPKFGENFQVGKMRG